MNKQLLNLPPPFKMKGGIERKDRQLRYIIEIDYSFESFGDTSLIGVFVVPVTVGLLHVSV
jgi:hypothetical protein